VKNALQVDTLPCEGWESFLRFGKESPVGKSLQHRVANKLCDAGGGFLPINIVGVIGATLYSQRRTVPIAVSQVAGSWPEPVPEYH
jgi:hypothetical protein